MQETQNLTPFAPDPEKTNEEPQGYRLSNLFFDSRTKRFIYANSANNLFNRYDPDESEIEESLGREKAHPGFEAEKRKNRSWQSKEFSSLETPEAARQKRRRVDNKPDREELEDQFKSLAIDG